MIRRLFLAESEDLDPWRNLALEQHLLETVPEDACILYLWQNRDTVVIGRNQNAWRECRTTRMQEDGAALARRLSGGGAVFHDTGNLNFTFLTHERDHDTERQTKIILTAVRSLGIQAGMTGRNDLTADGRKFSGCAYYRNRGRAYHHGTLLVDTDLDKMERYLAPSPAKLRARGVSSVRARVVDLGSLRQDITIPLLKEALINAARAEYALPAERYEEIDGEAVERLRIRSQSWEWNYGREIPFDLSCEDRFSWGGIRLEMQITAGIIGHVSAWTDSMRWELSGELETALTGCRLDTAAMCAAVSAACPEEADDICDLLRRQDL